MKECVVAVGEKNGQSHTLWIKLHSNKPFHINPLNCDNFSLSISLSLPLLFLILSQLYQIIKCACMWLCAAPKSAGPSVKACWPSPPKCFHEKIYFSPSTTLHHQKKKQLKAGRSKGILLSDLSMDVAKLILAILLTRFQSDTYLYKEIKMRTDLPFYLWMPGASLLFHPQRDEVTLSYFNAPTVAKCPPKVKGNNTDRVKKKLHSLWRRQ